MLAAAVEPETQIPASPPAKGRKKKRASKKKLDDVVADTNDEENKQKFTEQDDVLLAKCYLNATQTSRGTDQRAVPNNPHKPDDESTLWGKITVQFNQKKAKRDQRTCMLLIRLVEYMFNRFTPTSTLSELLQMIDFDEVFLSQECRLCM
jgi:hypothetical protein